MFQTRLTSYPNRTYRYINIIIACMFFISFTLPLVAQNGYHFRHLTTADGFADNTVWTIRQDNLGLIWMGTNDGLYRYDGNKLSVVRRNFLNDKGHGNSIGCLAEDSLQNIMWIGTDAGLFAWDMRRDTLLHLQWSQQTQDLFSSRISSLLIDRKGLLWVGIQDKGLYRLKNTLHSEPELIVKDDYINHLWEDESGQLWITSYNQGVFRYDGPSELTRYFYQTPGVLSFLKDKDDTLWIGTYNGLYCQSSSDKTPRRIELRQVSDASRLTVNDLAMYDHNTLYIATSDGLFLYSVKDGTAIQLKSDIQVAGSLNCDYLNSLYIDREQTVWISTYFGGVNYLSSGNRNFLSYDFLNYQITGRVVSAFAEDNREQLWIGTEDGGLSCYSLQTGEIKNYNPKQGAQVVPNFHNIHALMTDSERLYIGMSTGGVDILHLSSEKSEHLDIKDGLLSKTVYSFGHDHEGTVWIGTTKGLNHYYPDRRLLTKESGVPMKRINCIVEDDHKNMWICGEELGVFCKKAGDETWIDFCEKYAIPRTVYTLACVNTDLYIGVQDQGVFRYDTSRQELINLSLPDLGDQNIYKIVADGNSLWISTGKGLIRYNQLTRESDLYTTDNGLKTEQMNLNAGIRLQNGTLFFGSVAGLNGFHPNELVFNPHPPKVVLTQLFLNNIPTNISSTDSPLKSSILYTDQLTLDNKYISIGIRFAALSYTGSMRNRYKYKLEPFDKNWIYTDASTPIASYTNLPPGDYIFRVTACNSDGVWNADGCTLHLTVLPPWWAAWYMKALYASIVLFLCCYSILRLKRRHKKELEVLEARKTKELYDSKIEFFTHLAHEVRTPLTLILSPVEILMKQNGCRPFLNELQMIQRNSRRLLELVNRMMDFRKLEAQAFVSVPTKFDLRELLDQICTDFIPATTAKGIKLHTHWPENETCLVRSDREALTKIVMNLLSNAMKFSRTSIHISLKKDEFKGLWTISVQDDGSGIPASEQEHIFKPFYQIREQLPSDYIGTGIGLSLVRSLTENLGGSVSVNNLPDKGCVFHINLPAYKEDTEEHLLPADTSRPSVVVVVEDNDDMRSFLISMLQEQYTVSAYPDAQSAYNALHNHPSDLIVSDVMMPGMDGYTFCRILKNDLITSHIPVVLLTARTTDTDQVEGLQQGADAYLTKPFSPDVLKAQLNSLIENRNRQYRRFQKEPSIRLTTPTQTETDINFIRHMDEIILNHLSDNEFSVTTLLKELGMSRTAFFLKIKAVSGITFSDYVKIMRLKRAVELFKEGNTYISDVAYKTGFSSPSYFCNCFKKQFGLSPTEYLRQQEIVGNS